LLNGGLLTRDFLIEGIRSTAAWIALNDAAVADVRARVDALFAPFGTLKNPTEAETEKELIWPLLEAVGWADTSVQQNLSAKARDDVPDALLFGNAEAKAKAAPLPPWQRFAHGLCLVEAKRWNRVLDREETRSKSERGVPSTQMLRYLRRVDDVTRGGLRWGILTNGRHWRLYYKGALSVAEDFLEIDLGKVLGLARCAPDLLDKHPDGFADDAAWRAHVLKLFVLIFGRAAFLSDHRGETFHQIALRRASSGKLVSPAICRTPYLITCSPRLPGRSRPPTARQPPRSIPPRSPSCATARSSFFIACSSCSMPKIAISCRTRAVLTRIIR
jgi:hypothetical protein